MTDLDDLAPDAEVRCPGCWLRTLVDDMDPYTGLCEWCADEVECDGDCEGDCEVCEAAPPLPCTCDAPGGWHRAACAQGVAS